MRRDLLRGACAPCQLDQNVAISAATKVYTRLCRELDDADISFCLVFVVSIVQTFMVYNVNTHLLSVFPLAHEAAYARVTVTVIEDSQVPKPDSVLLEREAVIAISSPVISNAVVQQVMTVLDESQPVQLPLTAVQALALSAFRLDLHK